MAFWTYMLRRADGRSYVGHTGDPERRPGQHEEGGFYDYAARRKPVEQAWSEMRLRTKGGGNAPAISEGRV